MAASLLVVPAASASVATDEGDGDSAVRVGRGIYLVEASAEEENARRELRAREQPVKPRVVGGMPVSIAQVPWQVAVLISTSSGAALCGGSLLSPTMVLTAHHCVQDPRGGFADGAVVVSGRSNLSAENEGEVSGVTSVGYFVGESGVPIYDPRTGAWDVVLLRLAEPAQGQPIRIAGPDEAELWSTGRAAYVSGWGRTSENGPISSQLLAAELVVLPDAPCIRAYRPHPQLEFDPGTTTCAGTALGNRDSCYGDSGGPLAAPTSDGSSRLVGVVSFGNGCGRPRYPGVYGEVAGDPVRSVLRNAAFEIEGVDVVGSGAQPPRALTQNQAIELAWIYSEDQCYAWRKCRRYDAGPCTAQGGGFRCVVENLAKSRRRVRFTCSRTIYWTGEAGTIQRQSLGKWKCFRGW